SAIFAEKVIDRKRKRWAKTAKIGCSADQAYSHRRQCADNWRPLCSCAAEFAGRMASNIAPGASLRTRASPEGAWYSGTCCIWAWRRSIKVLEDGAARPRTLSLFPEDRCEGLLADASIVGVKLSELRRRRPRQWGACWLALMLWRELQLDQFWSKRLGVSRKGTHWDQVLFVLVAYRLLAPGSEWRLHREWFQRSALADLLGEDAGL